MTWLIVFTQRNASVVLLASLLVVALGIFAARSLQQELLPDINLPVVTVITPYPLAAPTEVEAQVTRPLENALGNLPELERFTSTSSENVSVIVLNFDFGTDLAQAEARANAAVNRIRASLPESAREPTVAAVRFGDAPILNLVASGDDPAALRHEVTQELVPLIERQPGVSRVDVAGTAAQEVRVTLDPAALREFNLSFEQVSQVVQSAPLSFPVGTLEQGELQLPVKIDSAAGTIAELSGLVVGAVPDQAAIARLATQAQQQGTAQAETQIPTAPARPGAPAAPRAPVGTPLTGTPAVPLRPVLLSDVAEVELVARPASSFSRYNGEEALGLAVYRTQEANTVLVSQRVQEAVEAAEDDLTAQVAVVQDQAGPIQRGVRSLLTEGMFGALFAVLVVAVFLANTRSTLITAVSIPMSLLVALILLYFQGLTLNILTLGGLTIALGRLIDDAIVVVENIYHKLDLGQPPLQATYEGAAEVASPVTSSTIATVAVFLPLAFVGGVAGEFLRPLALAVTLSVLASLLVAFTIVPLLSSLALRPRKSRAAPKPSLIERAYVPVITWVIRRPGLTLTVALLALVASASLIRVIPTNFIDSAEADAVRVTATLPTGTRLARADELARDLERRVAGVEGVESYQTTVGSAGGRFAFAGGASGTPISLTVIPREETELNALTQRLQLALSDAPVDTTVQAAASGDGGFSNVLRVNIEAESTGDLRAASAVVAAALRDVPEVENVRSNIGAERPALSIVIDQQAAYGAGAIPFQVVGAVQAALSGRVATTLSREDERLDVRLTYPEGQYATVSELEQLSVRTATGGAVPLGEIAVVREVASPVSITRADGERVAAVEADPAVENIGLANTALREALADIELPEGATWSLGGVTEQQNEAFGSLGIAIIAAVGLVYLIMVAAFRSLLTPFILLVSIPLVVVGAFPLMYVTGTPLGLSTMFAFLLLTGIVVTNAIVLIDLVERILVSGVDARTALIEGGRRRVRPIVMTALATIFALVPLALGLSESAGIVGQPLAITVIGGLTSSTLLTLLVVPALYLLLQGRRQGRVRERRGNSPA